jgi:hypothetical protein
VLVDGLPPEALDASLTAADPHGVLPSVHAA